MIKLIFGFILSSSFGVVLEKELISWNLFKGFEELRIKTFLTSFISYIYLSFFFFITAIFEV